MTEPLTPERRKKGCQPSFLTFFMALPCQDSPPSGDSVPHTSPCTPVPPGTAIQGPLAESREPRASQGCCAPGQKRFLINSPLSLQVKNHFHTSSPQGLLCIMTMCYKSCGWIFRHCAPCPLDHPLHQCFKLYQWQRALLAMHKPYGSIGNIPFGLTQATQSLT